MPFWCLFLATDCSGLESVSPIGSAWSSWTRRPAAAVLCQHVGAAREQRSCVCHSLALNSPVSCSSRIALDICAMSRLTLATMSAADPTAFAAEIESLPPATLYLTLSKLSTKGLRLLLDESISVVSDRLNAGDTAASQLKDPARQSCSCDLCADLGA